MKKYVNLSKQELIQPFDYSRYSCNVARTPGREHIFLEDEVELFEVIAENLCGDTLKEIKEAVEQGNNFKVRFKKKEGETHLKILSKVIAAHGKRNVILEYLKLKIEQITVIIKDNPRFEKLSIDHYGGENCVQQWPDPNDILRHELVGSKIHRDWLEDFFKFLLLQTENYNGDDIQIIKKDLALPTQILTGAADDPFHVQVTHKTDEPEEKRKIKPKKEDPNFENNFRDYNKRKSLQAEKLISELQKEHIIDKDCKWIDTPDHIRGLYLTIIENKDKIHLKTYKIQALYRIFCQKFHLPEDTSPERSRSIAPLEILERFNKIINSF